MAEGGVGRVASCKQQGTGAEGGDKRCGSVPGNGDRAEHWEKLTCLTHPELQLVTNYSVSPGCPGSRTASAQALTSCLGEKVTGKLGTLQCSSFHPLLRLALDAMGGCPGGHKHDQGKLPPPPAINPNLSYLQGLFLPTEKIQDTAFFLENIKLLIHLLHPICPVNIHWTLTRFIHPFNKYWAPTCRKTAWIYSLALLLPVWMTLISLRLSVP